MSADTVAVGGMRLELSLPGEPRSDGRGVVVSLLAALESALEAHVPERDQILSLPELCIDVTLQASVGGDWLASAADALARQIAEASAQKEREVPVTIDTRTVALPAGANVLSEEYRRIEPERWLSVARAGRNRPAGSLAFAPQSTEQRAGAHQTSDDIVPAASFPELESMLREIGAYARANALEALAAGFQPEMARVWLSTLAAALAAHPESGEGAAAPSAQANAIWAKALQAVGIYSSASQSSADPKPRFADPTPIRVILALSRLVELTPRKLTENPPLRAVVFAAIGESLREDAPRSSAVVPTAAPIRTNPSDRTRITAHGVEGTSEGEPRGRSRPLPAGTNADAGERPELSEGAATLPDLQDESRAGDLANALSWMFSRAAGLVYLIGPLETLGLSAALQSIRPGDPLAVYWVLRRAAARLSPALALEPACWALAGLLAPPDDEDRRDSLAGWGTPEAAALARATGRVSDHPIAAFDCWVDAAYEECASRWPEGGDPEPALRAALAEPGSLLDLGDALEVSLSFPEQYESLLRAGLLIEPASVPWLGGRALRFSFTN